MKIFLLFATLQIFLVGCSSAPSTVKTPDGTVVRSLGGELATKADLEIKLMGLGSITLPSQLSITTTSSDSMLTIYQNADRTIPIKEYFDFKKWFSFWNSPAANSVETLIE